MRNTASLEARGLGIRFGSRRAPLTVSEVDLTIPHGHTIGLVGESGSGKSSVAKALVGMNRIAEGSVVLDGVTIGDAKRPVSDPSRHGVQLVFQDPRTSLNPKMTIGDTLREAAALNPRTRGARRERALELLDLVHLDALLLGRYPHELSGGQLQRISIARALAVDPTYLLLDEVTASLDVSVQARILNLLRELQQELGFAMLYISHDLAVIRYVSDTVYVMQHGRIVEHGSVDTLFANPQQPYTQALLAAVPRLGGGRWQPAPTE